MTAQTDGPGPGLGARSPIVTIADLTFTDAGADRPALHGIDLEIGRGEFIAIMGRTGAGKTTLASCLNGIVPHLRIGERSGSVLVDGVDPASTAVREMARTVGMVFDDPESQMSQVTAAEEVALGLEHLGVAPAEMRERVAAALRVVGLAGSEERSPLRLSGGEQQRLAIAAVLVMRPAILVMDEPTSNLDPSGKREIFEIARRLNRDDGMTVIVAEHEVEVLARYADRVVVLDQGRIALQGPPADVLARVDDLRALGLRPPQVTEFAYELAGASSDLPLTVDAALPWLAARG